MTLEASGRIMDIMKTLINFSKALVIYAICYSIARYIFRGSDFAHVFTLYAPAWEEVLKSFGSVTVTIYFALIETARYAYIHGVWVIIPRLLCTLPMHVFAYKIGRKHGVIFAILYHSVFNFCMHSQYDMAIIYAYVYIVGITAMLKK